MKKYCSVIAAFLAIIVFFASISVSTVNAKRELGDVYDDGSNRIDQKDILAVMKYLAKQDSVSLLYADVNQDKKVDAKDLLLLKKYVAGRITEFPTSDTSASLKPTGTTNPNAPVGVDPYYPGVLARGKSYYNVAVNQVGYTTNARKIVKLVESAKDAPRTDDSLISNKVCYIVDVEKNMSVASFTSGRRAKFTKALYNSDETFVAQLDITDFKTPGTYRIYTPIGYSYEFTIKDNAYAKVMDDMIMSFYYQRCGGELSEEVLTKYDKYLAEKYGCEEGEYLKKYKSHVREACHIESKGSNKGQEVVIVDTYKNRTQFYYPKVDSVTSSTLSTIQTELYSKNISDDVLIFTKIDNDNVIISVVCDNHLTTEQANIVNGVAGKYGLKLSEKVENGTFVANSKENVVDIDKNGTLLKYSAKDFAGGLHDAGDYGRYTQPAAQTVADLCYAYELMPEVYTLDVVQDKVNENIPDILDYARWEAEFLLKMQAPEGGFYFKICTDQFASATGSIPENDKSFNSNGMRVQAVNMASTASAAGALATCAYTFKDIDPDFAARCLEASKKGYQYYQDSINSNTIEANVRNSTAASTENTRWTVGGGAYGGSSSESSRAIWYLANALYRVTGESTYSNYINSRISALDKNENNQYTEMNAQSHGGFGTLCYILTSQRDKNIPTDADITAKCINAFTKSADANVTNTNASQYYNALSATDKYSWGSNNQFAVMLKRNTVSSLLSGKTTDYVTAVRLNMNYMLGVNVLGYCFVTGESDGSTKNIHHYPSNIIKRSPTNGLCVPGLLAGGYTEEKSSAFADDAGKFRYRDEEGDYVCNEVCIYWNSSAILAFGSVVLQDIQSIK